MIERKLHCNVYKFKVLEGNVRDTHLERERDRVRKIESKQNLSAKEESALRRQVNS